MTTPTAVDREDGMDDQPTQPDDHTTDDGEQMHVVIGTGSPLLPKLMIPISPQLARRAEAALNWARGVVASPRHQQTPGQRRALLAVSALGAAMAVLSTGRKLRLAWTLWRRGVHDHAARAGARLALRSALGASLSAARAGHWIAVHRVYASSETTDNVERGPSDDGRHTPTGMYL